MLSNLQAKLLSAGLPVQSGIYDTGAEIKCHAQLTPEQQAQFDAIVTAWRLELPWYPIREERDRLLSACDWTQTNDVPLTAEQKAAWADYRQALRDIPQSFDSADDVIWPEAPNG